jgi:plasmid stability protein
MGQVLIRNIDDFVLGRLKKQAADKGLSLEESLRQALAQLARPSKDELIAEQRRIRAMSPPIKERPFAEDLIREDRDSR